MATPSQGFIDSNTRRSRIAHFFRHRRSSYAEYEVVYSDSSYLDIPSPPPNSLSAISQSLSTSALPTPLSLAPSSPLVHLRPKPLKPRVALDERSPAAALARGQAQQRNAPRGSRRANLSALLLRHRQSHSNNNNSHSHQHHHNNSHNHHRHARHFDVVGNDTVSSQGVPVFRGRVPRYPEPNTRRRASSAAAEVRFARANLSGGLGGVQGEAEFHDNGGVQRERSRVSVASSSLPSNCNSNSNSRGTRGGITITINPNAFRALEATEDALIRRAAARGASNTPMVARLRALRAERAQVQRNWITELEGMAAEVDALPVRSCQCVIDLQDIEAGDLVVRLPCMHVFHAECILPWFNSRNAPKCPIDRCPIPKDQIANLPVWRWGDE